MLARVSQQAVARYVVEITTIQKLAGVARQWQRLTEEAIEPNPFYGPDYLLAAQAHLSPQTPIRCIAIFEDGSRSSRMLGLFPMARAGMTDGVLVPTSEFYRNDYICSTMPLVHRDDPVGIWEEFLRRFERDSTLPRTLISALTPQGREASDAMAQALQNLGHAAVTVDGHERAALEPTASAEDYLARYSGQRRKTLRRCERRLTELGDYSLRTVFSGEPEGKAALETFLKLEASGWKGSSGSALACHAETAAFARQAFGGDLGRVEYDLLSLNGEVVAAIVNLVAGDTSFAVKSAYNEAFAAYSPGALLHTHAVRRAGEGQETRRMDSCSLPGHPVEAFWLEKQRIERIVFATRPDVSRSWLDVQARMMRSARTLKGWLKEQIATKG